MRSRHVEEASFRILGRIRDPRRGISQLLQAGGAVCIHSHALLDGLGLGHPVQRSHELDPSAVEPGLDVVVFVEGRMSSGPMNAMAIGCDNPLTTVDTVSVGSMSDCARPAAGKPAIATSTNMRVRAATVAVPCAISSPPSACRQSESDPWAGEEPVTRKQSSRRQRLPEVGSAKSEVESEVGRGKWDLRAYPSTSCLIPYCSSFLYRLLRGVSMSSAVREMFQLFSRSF